MASYTTNLNLKKPAGSENVAIGDINGNMDTIDSAYGTLSDQIASIPVIKTNSFTDTTSASGNVSQGHAKRVRVLSAWTDVSDRIVSPFPSSGAGATGQYTWWFQVYTDNTTHSVVANTSVTIYYAYIEE